MTSHVLLAVSCGVAEAWTPDSKGFGLGLCILKREQQGGGCFQWKDFNNPKPHLERESGFQSDSKH